MIIEKDTCIPGFSTLLILMLSMITGEKNVDLKPTFNKDPLCIKVMDSSTIS